MLDITTYLPHISGGILIGFAAIFLMLSIGKIAGISGILFGALYPNKEWAWKLAFIIGLILPGIYFLISNKAVAFTSNLSITQMLISGLCVGFGVKLGSGCTSGHGICGIGRLSTRSLIATITFMLSAILTLAISANLGF